MYKFINKPSSSILNFYQTSRDQYFSKICVFCNYCHRHMPTSLTTTNFLQQRHQSSNTNSAMLISKVKLKKKKKLKKYAELLEVTDSATSNRKASITKLKPEDFSRLVDKPEITLDKLHEIDNKYLKKKNEIKPTSNVTYPEVPIIDEDSYHSIKDESKAQNIPTIPSEDPLSPDSPENKIIDSSDNLNHTNIVEKVEMAHNQSNIELNNILNLSSFEKFLHNTSKKKRKMFSKEQKDKEKVVDEKFKLKLEIINKNRLKQYNELMLAYTSVCLNCNNSLLFDKLVSMFKRQRKDGVLHINNIKVFNMIIEKFSLESNFESALEIFNYLRENNLQPDVHTYAYIVNCIGLMECDEQKKLDYLNKIKSEMQYDNISLNDIVTKTILKNNQKELIEEVIRILDKNFRPNYELQDLGYVCKLLKDVKQENINMTSTVKGLSDIDFVTRLKKQMELEMNGEVVIRSIAKQSASTKQIKFWKNQLSSIENEWKNTVKNAFKRNLNTLKKIEFSNPNAKTYLHPFLSVLHPDDYVHIIMRKVRALGLGAETYTLSYYNICHGLGLQVFNGYEMKLKQNYGVNDKIFEIYQQYSDWFVKRNDKFNFREKWMLLEHELNKHGASSNLQIPNWPYNMLLSTGIFLFNIILNDLRFNANVINGINKESKQLYPAFFKLFRQKGVKLETQVKPHPMIAKLYKDSSPEDLSFITTLLPSFCPPRPWTNIANGGYVLTKSNVVRVPKTGEEQWERLEQTDPKNLFPSLDSLNQLGSIPWMINKNILNLAIEIFQNNGSEKLNIPQPASAVQSVPKIDGPLTEEKKKKLMALRTQLRTKKMEMHSLWCEALYRLSLADHFKNEIFWLPHNMDFRGRVYPIPPHLSHLSYDLGRSMLVFAVKKPLGPKGLDWLKLHLVNLTGFKKREPIAKRLEYANEILDTIIDSAEKPVTGKMWWVDSENPWQTLATCMEVAAVLKSPNPQEFESGFPIHQDGSCNGLQHYAALGRDVIGADSVNLSVSDVPKDVYNNVATMIETLRKKDVEKGVKIAKLLEGCVERKVIKQTVMTTVYGVTFYGAKLQIVRQLEDLKKLPQEHLWEGAIYLVNKTFLTLRSMFTSAREIQDWFTQCCHIICSMNNKNMEWVTPLGLPVVQPYSKQMTISPKNPVSSKYLKKPNTAKQTNAFPPNFIHSLDSTHMMLTSIHCEYKGITFVSVHDCFWTHPCTVEIMNKICREQFVRLHSEPILEDLAQFLIKKFVLNDSISNVAVNSQANTKQAKEKLSQALLCVPKRGDLNLNDILSSTYFFS